MQHTLREVLSEAQARHIRVAYEDEKAVVFEADSGAMAARIRQLAPRLLTALRRRFPEVAGVRCEVRIAQRTPAAQAPKRRITPTGEQALAGLAGTLPAGDLRDALERLLRGAKQSHGQDQSLQGEEGEPDSRDQ